MRKIFNRGDAFSMVGEEGIQVVDERAWHLMGMNLRFKSDQMEADYIEDVTRKDGVIWVRKAETISMWVATAAILLGVKFLRAVHLRSEVNNFE